jgi:hypothetical protein
MTELQQDVSIQGYEELRVEVVGRGQLETYQVRVTSSSGETSIAEFRLPVSEGMIEDALASASRGVDQWVQRSVPSDALDPIRDLGRRLFDALCGGRLRPLYERELARLAALNQGLRARLIVDEPRLEALPWEFLYDSARGDFIALSIRLLLVRHPADVPLRAQLELLTLPLRVLVLAADLTGQFGADVEIQRLRNLNPEGDRIEIVELIDVTQDQLVQALLTHKPHVLHFIGTGFTLDTALPGEPSRQVLAVMSEPGRRSPNPELWKDYRPVDTEQLEKALRDQPQLRLVYLSACHTDWLAGQMSRCVPAAIGMRGLVTAQVCACFAEGLYRAILDYHPIEAAVTLARRALDLEHPGGREWGSPVFYLTAPEGVVLRKRQPSAASASLDQFEVQGPKQSLDPGSQREWQRLQSLLAVHRRNLEALERQEPPPGLATPDFVKEEINQVKEKIAGLEGSLRRLEA